MSKIVFLRACDADSTVLILLLYFEYLHPVFLIEVYSEISDMVQIYEIFPLFPAIVTEVI
jgi:hypothetical protein